MILLLKTSRIILTSLLLVLFAVPVLAAEESRFPEYVPVTGIAGNLTSVGSDTLANLMIRWSDAFRRFYPNVIVQIQAAGSGTATPALTERTANVGPVSRELRDSEIAAFENRYGYRPTAVPVALDALAIYVHKDNPISGLTIEQLDAIFSANQRCGSLGSFSDWGQLGLPDPWLHRNIQLFGRNSVSGTYGYFKTEVLCWGDFRKNVNEQPGSASVVQAVGTSINAIGYSSIGYRTAGVRAVPIGREGQGFIEANAANAASGSYPLSRFLYIYLNKPPNADLPPLEKEFLKLILSEKGQHLVKSDGYVPLPVEVVRLGRESLGLDHP